MTTAWSKSLLPGSFRGARFFVTSATSSGGRRINTIEYPERDDPQNEDTGRSPREFSFSAYVLGSTAFADRDKLLRACEERGAGTLAHPYRGKIQAVLKSYSVSESEAEARIIRFDLSFVQDFPFTGQQVKDPKLKVFKLKKSLLEKIIGWFEKAYDTARKPVTAIEKATATVDKGLSVVAAAKQVTEAVPEFGRAMRDLQGRALALSTNATAMAQNMTSIVNWGTDFTEVAFAPLLDNATAQSREMRSIQASNAAPLVANNGDLGTAIQQLTILSALSGELGLMTLVEFDTPEDAIAAEQDLIARFDAILNQIDPTDELYRAIAECLTALHEDLSQRVVDLPRLAELPLEAQRNALELSQEVYGSLDELDDLILRNGIIHPGFLSTANAIRLKVIQ